MERLKREWVTMWQESPRQWHFERIDNTFPFNGYRKHQNQLSRAQASLMIQVRSGHLPLNTYLHKIKKVESNCCKACCINPDDETPLETIKHFIYDCEVYTHQRHSLTQALGATNLPLKDIMMETKHMKELAKYITRTGQFRPEG
jgi:hypothetical protein